MEIILLVELACGIRDGSLVTVSKGKGGACCHNHSIVTMEVEWIKADITSFRTDRVV